MANTFNLGNGNWAQKTEKLLAYNAENDNYKPLPFSFDRGSTATRVNRDGLIETVGVDEPRIDFLNNTKGHLLLEPSRQNKLLQSNQFDTTWTLSASITLTSGQIGVGGSSDAWLLKRNSTGSRYVQQALSSSSATYSYSVYLKAESTNWAYVWSYDNVASVNAYFDLENGVVGSTSGSNLDSATIESVGNGWYRCILTYTQPTTLVRIYPAYSNGSVSIGTDNGIYIQYAQLEEGSYATSYIPTSGSAVTRSEDRNVQTVPSGIYGTSQGSVYIEGIVAPHDLGGQMIFTAGIGTSNLLYIWIRTNGLLNVETYVSTSQVNISTPTGTLNVGDYYKIAVAYQDDDCVLYLNGTLMGSETSGTAPNPSTVRVGNYNSSSYTAGMIKDCKIYNTRLSNSELQALTTI